MLKKKLSFRAIVLFLVFLWTPLILFPFNCPDGHCPLAPNSSWSSNSSAPHAASEKQTGDSLFRTEFAAPHPAVARICVENARTRNYGTGTWIRISKEQCAVLTCAHLFETNSPERIAVSFPNHFSFNARIQAIDRDWDVALLQSAVGTDSSFSSFPAPLILTLRPPKPDEYARLCGYGADGRSLWMLGAVRGYCRLNAVSGAHTLVVAGFARQGDSGAPIMTLEGDLAGVLWGTDGQSLYGTWSGQIQKVLKIDLESPPVLGEYFLPEKNIPCEWNDTEFKDEGESRERSTAVDYSKIIDLQELPKLEENGMKNRTSPRLFDEKDSLEPKSIQSYSREFSKEKITEEKRVPENSLVDLEAANRTEDKSSSSSFSSRSFSFKNSGQIEEALRSRIFGECARNSNRAKKGADAQVSARKNERSETKRESDGLQEKKKEKKTVASSKTKKNLLGLLIGLYLLVWSMPVAAFFLLWRKKIDFSQKKFSWESENSETDSNNS